MTDAKVLINLDEGILEFEGDGDFVERQMARFEDLINKSLAATKKPPSKITNNSDVAPKDDVGEDEACDEFDTVFEVHDDKLHVIKDLPGSNVKAKTLSAALLVCYGKTIKGYESTLLDDVRTECERHGCYNSKKFATYIRSYNNLFLESGSGKSSTLKLTVPGSNLAKDLAERLHKDEIGDFFSQVKSKPISAKASGKKAAPKVSESTKSSSSSDRPGPGAIIDILIDEDFFDEQKGIADIISHCKESKVLTYKNSDLSPSLGRAVKSNKLKREKNADGQYGYSKP